MPIVSLRLPIFNSFYRSLISVNLWCLMKNKFFTRVLPSCAIAAVFFTVAGCYTLLKHPSVADEERPADTAHAEAVTYADDCGSCHASPSYAAVHDYASPYRSSYDRWYYYYEYPWWVRYYAPASGDGGEGADEQQRPFGRRHRGSEDSQPSQTAASGSTPAPSPSIISTSGNESGKSDPPPAQKDERRDDRRGGTDEKDSRREKKP